MKKRLLSIVLSVMMVMGSIPLSLLNVTAFDRFWYAEGGDGSEDSPYEIRSLDQLNSLANEVNYGTSFRDTYFVLTEDIGSLDWDGSVREGLENAIGNEWYAFDGHFDGAGHTVYLKMEKWDGQFFGLFAMLGEDGTIKNVKTAGYVSGHNGGCSCFAGICGKNNGTIINCVNNAQIYGEGDRIYNFGGICGENNGTITTCINNAQITASQRAYCLGGICGKNEYGKIINCENNGQINNNDASICGGICGENCGSGIIANCANFAQIQINEWSNPESVGGVCGKCSANDRCIINCINTAKIEGGDSFQLGGICGRVEGSSVIKNCYYNKEVRDGLNGYGRFEGWDRPDIQGMHPDQMKTQSGSIYDGWDSVCNGKALTDVLNEYISDPENSEHTTGWYNWKIGENGYPTPIISGYVVMVAESKNGTVTVEGGSDIFDAGETVTLNVESADGFKLKKLVYNDGEDHDITDKASFVMPASDVTVTAEFEIIFTFKGEGTKESPYLLESVEDLTFLATAVNGGESCVDKYFKLTKDIGTVTAQIGTKTFENVLDEQYFKDTGNIYYYNKFYDFPFEGHFDGDGHTVNLNIQSRFNAGLFGLIGQNGIVENVITAGSVTGLTSESDPGISFGGVCAENRGTVTKCVNNAAVTLSPVTDMNNSFGGVCASNSGTLTDCTNNAAISSSNNSGYFGGVCAFDSGTVQGCVNNGRISGTSIVSDGAFGGVCGYLQVGTITNCINKAEIVGTSSLFFGGICGYNLYGSTVSYCTNDGAVTGNDSSQFGGICGYSISKIKNVTNNGVITGSGASSTFGGICGFNQNYGGYWYGPIFNCLNMGNVVGTDTADIFGGICGRHETTLDNCINAAAVLGNTSAKEIGGISGKYYNGGTATGCYFDKDKSKNDAQGIGIASAQLNLNSGSYYTVSNPVINKLALVDYINGYIKNNSSETNGWSYWTKSNGSLKMLDAIYEVVVSELQNGKLSVSSKYCEPGQTVKVIPEPFDGYILRKVMCDGEILVLDENEEYTFTMPEKDVTVSARYSEPFEEIVAADSENTAESDNFVATSTASDQLAAGDEYTLTISAEKGSGLQIKRIGCLIGDIDDVSAFGKLSASIGELVFGEEEVFIDDIHSDTVVITGSELVKFSKILVYYEDYVPPKYNVVVSPMKNGNLWTSPDRCEAGTTVELHPFPYGGYVIAKVVCDGEEIVRDETGKYCFTMPEKDVTVSATYSEPYEEIIAADSENTAESDNFVATSTASDQLAAGDEYTLTISTEKGSGLRIKRILCLVSDIDDVDAFGKLTVSAGYLVLDKYDVSIDGIHDNTVVITGPELVNFSKILVCYEDDILDEPYETFTWNKLENRFESEHLCITGTFNNNYEDPVFDLNDLNNFTVSVKDGSNVEISKVEATVAEGGNMFGGVSASWGEKEENGSVENGSRVHFKNIYTKNFSLHSHQYGPYEENALNPNSASTEDETLKIKNIKVAYREIEQCEIFTPDTPYWIDGRTLHFDIQQGGLGYDINNSNYDNIQIDYVEVVLSDHTVLYDNIHSDLVEINGNDIRQIKIFFENKELRREFKLSENSKSVEEEAYRLFYDWFYISTSGNIDNSGWHCDEKGITVESKRDWMMDEVIPVKIKRIELKVASGEQDLRNIRISDGHFIEKCEISNGKQLFIEDINSEYFKIFSVNGDNVVFSDIAVIYEEPCDVLDFDESDPMDNGRVSINKEFSGDITIRAKENSVLRIARVQGVLAEGYDFSDLRGYIAERFDTINENEVVHIDNIHGNSISIPDVFKNISVYYECTHPMVEKAEICEPTCDSHGVKQEYYYCMMCGDCFVDSEGKFRIDEAHMSEYIIEPLGHDYPDTSEYTYNNDATCMHAGTKSAKCRREGCMWVRVIDDEDHPQLSHSYTGEIHDNQDGTHSFSCINGCGGYGATENCVFVGGVCKCGATLHTHTLMKVPAKDATCTEDGISTTYYVCEGEGSCGKYFSDENGENEISAETAQSYTIGKMGHNFTGNYINYEGNKWAKKCSRCDTYDTENALTGVAVPTVTGDKDNMFLFTGKEIVALESNDYYTVTDGSKTAVGKYTATVTLKDTDNYKWEEAFDGEIEWYIVNTEYYLTEAPSLSVSGKYNQRSYYMDGNTKVVVEEALLASDKSVTFEKWYLHPLVQYRTEPDGSKTVRFVSMLDNALDSYIGAGFNVIVTDKGGATVYSSNTAQTAAYESIIADGVTLTPADYGASFFFTDADFVAEGDMVANPADYTVTVSAFLQTPDNTYTGAPLAFTLAELFD